MNQRKIRIIYVFSFIDRSILNEAIALHLSQVSDFDPAFILLDHQPGAFADFLKEHKLRHWNIKVSGKLSLLNAFFKILRILIAEKPQVINVNLLESTVTALPAAWLSGIPVRILTRHYGTLHHDYHPHFVKLDRLFNRMATHILAPSEIISKILREREQADPKKITVIPHGLPLDDFATVPSEKVNACAQNTCRAELHIRSLVLFRALCTGRVFSTSFRLLPGCLMNTLMPICF